MAAELRIDELLEGREQLRERIQEAIHEELGRSGLRVESLAIDDLVPAGAGDASRPAGGYRDAPSQAELARVKIERAIETAERAREEARSALRALDESEQKPR